MRTIEKKVFNFNELNDKAKETVLDKFRSDSTIFEDCYSDDVVSNYKEFLEFIGFDDTKIYYSGFWSQGDGACFAASYRYEAIDKKKFSNFALSMDFMGRIVNALIDIQKPLFYSLRATITQRGRYYHENSMSYEITDSRKSCYDTIDNEDFEEVCRDIATSIYSALESEYSYTQTDEFIIEHIEANEYEFYENGEIY